MGLANKKVITEKAMGSRVRMAVNASLRAWDDDASTSWPRILSVWTRWPSWAPFGGGCRRSNAGWYASCLCKYSATVMFANSISSSIILEEKKYKTGIVISWTTTTKTKTFNWVMETSSWCQFLELDGLFQRMKVFTHKRSTVDPADTVWVPVRMSNHNLNRLYNSSTSM